MEFIKSETKVMKVIISCSADFDVNSIPCVTFLDNLKEVHTSHDEFKGDDEFKELTHVINVFSNVLDLDSLTNRVVRLQTGVSIPQGYERGFFHYTDYCIRIYSESRISYMPLEGTLSINI